MLIRMRTAAVLFTAALLGTTLSSQQAFAKDSGSESSEKKKIAVGAFAGQKNQEVRAAVIDALKNSGSYEVSETSDVKPDSADGSFAESAQGLGVAAIVVARVKKGFLLVISVRGGSDGALIDDVELPGGGLIKLKRQIKDDLVSRVEGPLSQAKGAERPPEAEAEAEAPAEAEAAPEDESSSSSGGISPFDVTVGLRPVHRKFQFENTIAEANPNGGYSNLLSYELPLGPALFIDLNWYPAAHFMSGPATWFGVTAGFEKGFATESVYAEGDKANERTLKTDMQHWYAGARFRFPIGEHQVGAAATFGNHKFELKGNEGATLIVPDVSYQYVRIGVDGLFRFGDILVGAHLGKRLVSKAGEIETLWFKNAKAQSLEAGVMLGYRLFGPLDLVAGVDWLRYGFDFNPVEKRDPAYASYVAGGAVDEYISGFLGFRYTLPGGVEEAAAAPSTDGAAASAPASSE